MRAPVATLLLGYLIGSRPNPTTGDVVIGLLLIAVLFYRQTRG